MGRRGRRNPGHVIQDDRRLLSQGCHRSEQGFAGRTRVPRLPSSVRKFCRHSGTSTRNALSLREREGWRSLRKALAFDLANTLASDGE